MLYLLKALMVSMKFRFCCFLSAMNFCFADYEADFGDSSLIFYEQESEFSLEEKGHFLMFRLAENLNKHDREFAQHEDIEEVDSQEIWVDEGNDPQENEDF